MSSRCLAPWITNSSLRFHLHFYQPRYDCVRNIVCVLPAMQRHSSDIRHSHKRPSKSMNAELFPLHLQKLLRHLVWYQRKATVSLNPGLLKGTHCDTRNRAYSSSSCLLSSQKENSKTSEIPNQGDNPQKENIVTVPNILTLSRAVLSPVLGYLIVSGSYHWALGIFIYAGITDYVDGWIARRWPSQRTVCGTVVDPIADKLLVVIFTASLCYTSLIPGPLAFLIIFKDVIMLIGGFVVRWMSLDKPVTVKQFFDFKHASMEMKPLTISKWNTALQISTLAVSLAAPVFGFVGHPILPVLWYSTGLTTVLTGISYAFAKDAYEIKQPKKNK